MKKTIDISLAGILFHVEEDAYDKLKKYLKAVRNSMENQEDINEVMHEIEARIAELLLQKQSHPQQVINIQNIDEIIEIMGQPEDYDVENEIKSQKQSAAGKKALFRDMEHSVLGGVAAGLSHYIGMDMTIMRLLFVILLFVTHGSFILIYLLLWIVIPKAKTASDKLKMKGENINVDNIVEQVNAEEESDKKKIKLGETVENSTHELGQIFSKLIGFIIALISGIILTGMILSLTVVIPYNDLNINLMQESLSNMINLPLGWITALGLFLIGFPIALLFILGLKLLFPNTKSLGKNVFITGGTIWIITFLFLMIKTTSQIYRYEHKTKILDKKIVWNSNKDTLFVKNNSFITDTLDNFITDNRIYFNYYPSNDSLFHIKIYQYATGITKKEAINELKKIRYVYQIDSLKNQVVFGEKMSYPDENFIINRKIKIKIYIPDGKFVQLSPHISRFSKAGNCKYPSLIQNNQHKINCIEKYKKNDIADEKIIINGKKINIQAGDNGVDIAAGNKNKNAKISLNEKGIHINSSKKDKKIDISIDEKGIIIKNENHEK